MLAMSMARLGQRRETCRRGIGLTVGLFSKGDLAWSLAVRREVAQRNARLIRAGHVAWDGIETR